MPLRVESGAKIITDNRITPIRVINTLADRVAKRLSAEVKATMLAKDARYAESTYAVAELRPGSSKGDIDARALYALVESGQLTRDQFLDCVRVSKDPLKKHLPGNVVDGLCSLVVNPQPSLITELREGVEWDVDELAVGLGDLFAKAVPIKAA